MLLSLEAVVLARRITLYLKYFKFQTNPYVETQGLEAHLFKFHYN